MIAGPVMEPLILKGPSTLCGEVEVAGAKNAVLVIMIATLLGRGRSVIRNIPLITDVDEITEILRGLGATVTIDDDLKIAEIDSAHVDQCQALCAHMGKIRASILVAGPLLARFGRVSVPMPGGCSLARGGRPIDYHLRGFEQMGAQVAHCDGFFELTMPPSTAKTVRRVIFDYPSVGATENILMCAAALAGETHIVHAALEPEVLNLIDMLRAMGASIDLQTPHLVRVKGNPGLRPVTHEIIPDRLEAGSFLMMLAATKGEGGVPNARPDHLELVIEKLRCMGHELQVGREMGVWIKASKTPRPVDIKTVPYPGFPTDLQSQMMVTLLGAAGSSTIAETVWDSRFTHVAELEKMGAKITIEGQRCIIDGGLPLYGADVQAPNLRAACALVIAGLMAEGETRVFGMDHLYRGYEQFERKLKILGANLGVVQTVVKGLPRAL